MSGTVLSTIRKLKRLVKQLNYISETLGPDTVKITIPGGLHYEAFEKSSSSPQVWSILSMVSSTMFFSFWSAPKTESYVDFHKHMQNTLLILGSLSMEVDQHFYETSSPKFPIAITNKLSYVGKSSLRFTYDVSCPLYTGLTPYAMVSAQFILLDPTTLRAVELSKWWRDQYGHITQSGTPLIIKRNGKPEVTNKYQMTVQYSDTDYNGHTGGVCYARFCYNACMHGVSKHQYKTLNESIVKNGIKSIELSFRNESNAGDSLEIFSWEGDGEETAVLNFEIRKNIILCSTAKFVFYPNKAL